MNEIKEATDYHATHEVMRWIEKCKEGQAVSELHPKGSFFNAVRLNYDKPCNTITQTLGGCSGLFHPKQNRLLTIPELQRIMSFPDDFEVTGIFMKRWERMGRAVPPLLMKAIADNLYKEVISKYKEDEI